MIRQPRESQPDPITSEIAHFLAPLVIFPWGPLAMSYLGVPIVVGVSGIFLLDVARPTNNA
jgi:hypothetical protein